jgi:repressor of flagellae, putative
LNTSSTKKGGIQVGYKIKELREALKMTQEELAEKSGVSRGTISALENGVDRTTTSKTLVKLAQALNTSVDRIFFTEGV